MREFASDAAGQRAQLRAERAARGEPVLPAAKEWGVVAWRLETAGFPAGAAEAWRASLAADGGSARAHLGLGRALVSLGDGDGAAAAVRASMAAHDAAAAAGGEALLDDPDEDPWYVLGLAEHLRGRLDAAVEAYGRAAERFPWFAEPLLETARAELARGAKGKAADAARRGLERTKWKPEMSREFEALLREAGG